MAELLVRDLKEPQQGNEARAVLGIYYEGKRKVLVLDDVFGNELETVGFARLPNNPILAPNGNPLTARAATNLAITETPRGSLVGIYRGYGEPIAEGKEGKSRIFPVFFEEDDVTPKKPLPERAIFNVSGKKHGLGAEDGKLVWYNGFYFCPFIAARKPDRWGTMYCGEGAILLADLELEKRFPLIGLPCYIKDIVPLPQVMNDFYLMHIRPSPPDHFQHKRSYKKFYVGNPGIWLAISSDLIKWVVLDEVLMPLEGENKIGGGGAVYEPELGGIVEYIHGVSGEGTDRRNYRGRAALFDDNNPAIAIKMTRDFLNPEEAYEKNDAYGIDHVFPMGAVRRRVRIHDNVYSAHLVSAGTGDTSSSLYFVLVSYLKENLKPINTFKFSRN